MNFKKILLAVLLCLGLITFLTACGKNEENKGAVTSNTSEQIRFTDLKDREIVLDKPASRIFLGFYEESYLSIAKDFSKVVSISKADWTDYFYAQYLAYENALPELKNITDTGSIYKGSFSMESLLNSKPDVAILAPFQYAALAENVQKLEDAGIKVVVIDYNSLTLEKHLKSTRILGMVTGNVERAETLAQNYEKAIQDVQNKVASISNRKKVYIELGSSGPKELGTSYGNYMWGGLVKLAGGDNIGEGRIKTFGKLDPAYVLTTNPDMILFAGSKWVSDPGDNILMGFGVKPEDTNSRLAAYMQRDGWSALNAVKNDNIFVVDHGGLKSTYDYVYVQFIAKALYPELFRDVDPVKNMKEFYQQYLPVSATGTFMLQYKK